MDRDQAALDAAEERLAQWRGKVTLVHSNFCELDAILDGLGLDGVDDFACCRALSERTGLPVPAQIAALEPLPVRHTLRCAPEEMKNMLLKAFQGAR